MPSPIVRVPPNPKVGVPHGLDIDLDGDTIISYQWQTRNTPAGAPTNISGATSATYTPTESVVGKYLAVEVTFASDTGDNVNLVPELLIRKHSAAAPGPRFVVRNHNTPRVKTSYEAMRDSGNP